MEKKKRVVTKIGNIFCVEIKDQFKSYFQYIANDMSMLNSSVIRVFKRHYPLDANPSMDEIIDDEVFFYAHTILRAGIAFGTWYKVGTSKNIGSLENIMFRMFDDVNWGITGIKKSYRWRVFELNGEVRFVGEMNDTYRKYDYGVVLPYFEIPTKIETGKFKIKLLE